MAKSAMRVVSEVALHPLNTEFTWHDRQGPYVVVGQQHADSWNTNGFFLLRNVLDEAQVRALTDAIDPLEKQAEERLVARGGRVGVSRAGELTFTVHLVLHSAAVREFVTLPVLAGLCVDLLGPDCRLYWDQAVYKKPGTTDEFPWHQDNGYNYVVPQDYLTCWVPLTAATVENGCPWVVPRLHRRGTLRHWPTPLGYQCLVSSADAVPVEADPGDIVVFSSLTPHRTGPNLTGDTRKAYIVQYARDDAEMVSSDGERSSQRDPARQFLVAVNGKLLDPRWPPNAGEDEFAG